MGRQKGGCYNAGPFRSASSVWKVVTRPRKMCSIGNAFSAVFNNLNKLYSERSTWSPCFYNTRPFDLHSSDQHPSNRKRNLHPVQIRVCKVSFIWEYHPKTGKAAGRISSAIRWERLQVPFHNLRKSKGSGIPLKAMAAIRNSLCSDRSYCSH